MFHGQVDIFMDVAFDSLHEDVRLLSFRLSSMSFGSIPIGSLECRLAHFICQQCEASLQFLLLLCQQKLFGDRILKNKVLTYLSRCRFYAIEGKKECLLQFPFFLHYERSVVAISDTIVYMDAMLLEAGILMNLSLMQELSRNGGILSLSHTILKLVVPYCLKGSTDIVASISRLKAKILSIVS
jgi:hypothetical protein